MCAQRQKCVPVTFSVTHVITGVGQQSGRLLQGVFSLDPEDTGSLGGWGLFYFYFECLMY